MPHKVLNRSKQQQTTTSMSTLSPLSPGLYILLIPCVPQQPKARTLAEDQSTQREVGMWSTHLPRSHFTCTAVGQVTHSTLCQRLFHHQPFPSVKRIVKQNGHSSHSRLKHVQYVASVLLNSLSSLFSLPTPMLAVNCHFL